jgi:hypothetical protein
VLNSSPTRGLCHNKGNAILILNEVKNLTLGVILKAVKDLESFFALLRACPEQSEGTAFG